MKLFPVLLLCLLSCACGDRVYYPSGNVAYAGYTNFDGEVVIQTRGFYFRQTGRRDASTPTRAALESAGNAALKLGLGATGAVIP